MENNPTYYDGSTQINHENTTEATRDNKPFEITDEMRKNIGGNPFIME